MYLNLMSSPCPEMGRQGQAELTHPFNGDSFSSRLVLKQMNFISYQVPRDVFKKKENSQNKTTAIKP